MAQNQSSHSAGSDVRHKAAAMRLEQQAADRRLRNIIIGSVSAVVVLVVALIAYVVATSPVKNLQGSPEELAALAGDYADGRPIILSHNGVGQADEALKTVTEYFDYSCHACSQGSVMFGADLAKGAKDGKYNLAFQPVNTARGPYSDPATAASLVVANKAPEQWLDFHEALLAFHWSEYEAGRGTVIGAASASFDKVKEIAASVGVPQEVVDSFIPGGATAYLDASSAKWAALSIDDRGSVGTPEVIVDNKKVNLGQFVPAEIMSQIDALVGAQ